MLKYFIRIIASWLVISGLSGCTALRPTSPEKFVWPPPPEKARISWLGVYRSQLDLPSTSLRRFKEAIVGEDQPTVIRKPVDVKSDPQRNRFYVADLDAGGIFVFDLNEPGLSLIHPSDGPFKPISLTIDANGAIYALEIASRKIHLFEASGSYARTITLPQTCKRPVAIQVEPSGENFYVVDSAPGRLVFIDKNGAELFSTNKTTVPDEVLNRPTGIAINSKSEIIISDAFNARYYVYSRDGVPLSTHGTRGDGASDFQLIKGVAVDSDDNIYVIDSRSNSIKIFDRPGNFLYSLGGYRSVRSSATVAPGGFVLPVSISIDSSDKIYVADQLNQQIQVFQYISDSAENSHHPSAK